MGAFGERLKREREKRKITLDDVAKSTKIGTRLLSAIEEEKFDQLPGGIFNKGFVRSYARHLGLNEDQTVADYTEAYRASHPEESTVADPEAEGRKILEQRVQRVQQERPRMERIPWGKAAIALLLLAFGVALWGSYSRYSQPSSDAAARKPKTAKAAPAQTQSSIKPAEAPALNQVTAPTENQTTAESVPDATKDDLSATETFHVAIHAREDSWIHINVDGKDLPEDTLTADTQKSIQASNQLVIRAGNIGALDFFFNGQKLPVQGDLDQAKTVIFDVSGLVHSAPKIQPVSAPNSTN